MNAFTKWLYGKSIEKCQKEAEQAYQIAENGGKLYLTFNGALVCPMDMFKQEPIDALKMIRDLYVKRNATDYDRRTNTESL